MTRTGKGLAILALVAALFTGLAAVAHADAQAQLSTNSSASTSDAGNATPDLATTIEEGVTASGARRMRTDATYFPAERRVVALTRTWNAVKLTGFTGGVIIVFEDANGRVIGATGLRTFGVDGTWIGRSDRTEHWEETLDAPWLDRAVRIRAVHTHAGRNRLKDIVNEAVSAATPVIDLINRLNSVKPKQ